MQRSAKRNQSRSAYQPKAKMAKIDIWASCTQNINVSAFIKKQPEPEPEPTITRMDVCEINAQDINRSVEQMYGGQQCSNCDKRFKFSETTEYTDHLNWHFQQNRKSKTGIHSRGWYKKTPKWGQKENVEESDDSQPNFFEIQNIMKKKNLCDKQKAQPSCSAGSTELHPKCSMCYEQFDQFFDDEEEEWRLRNAIRKDDILAHPNCL